MKNLVMQNPVTLPSVRNANNNLYYALRLSMHVEIVPFFVYEKRQGREKPWELSIFHPDDSTRVS